MSNYKHSAPSKSKGGTFLAVAAGLVLVLAAVCFVLMHGGNKIGDVTVLDNVLTDLDRDGLQGAVERIIDQNPITEEIGVFFLSETYTIKAEQIGLVYDADVMAENAWKAGQRSILERLLGSKEILPVAQPAVKWDESKLQGVLADAAAQLSRILRVKNLTIGYDFTNLLRKSSHFDERGSRLQVYFSGENLLTLTKYSGLDPECNGYDAVKYPVSRVLSLGVKLTY